MGARRSRPGRRRSRAPCHRPLAAAAALVSWLAAGHASAQDVGDIPIGAEPRLGDRESLAGSRPYWAAGKPRWFLASDFDVGVISFRPQAHLGWGRPHDSWGGLEVTPQVSLSGVSLYAGPTISVPGITLRGGARYFASADRYLLQERETYTREQLEIEVGPLSRFLSVEGELSLDIPLPLGSLNATASVHYLNGVPEPFNVFEQSLRVVVDPPLVWRSRTAYLVGLGKYETMRLGGLLEFVGVPKRDEVMVRVGPAMTVSLTHHLQAVAAASFSIESKDNIGLESADFGQISLRYRWATGDRWPEFP